VNRSTDEILGGFDRPEGREHPRERLVCGPFVIEMLAR
jgi:hypothetical protein